MDDLIKSIVNNPVSNAAAIIGIAMMTSKHQHDLYKSSDELERRIINDRLNDMR